MAQNKILTKGDTVQVREQHYHEFEANTDYTIVDFLSLAAAVYLEDSEGNRQAVMVEDIIQKEGGADGKEEV